MKYEIKKQMQMIMYRKLSELQELAKLKQIELYETNTSYSFRVFENKQCTELHILYK